MTDAELRVAREYLGLTIEALAQLLGVDVRTVRRWESGSHRIPDGVAGDVEVLEARAADLVSAGINELHAAADPSEMGLVVWRSDEDYWAEHPQQRPLPATWHRAIVARIVHEVPGIEIVYADDVPAGSLPVARQDAVPASPLRPAHLT